MADGPVLALQAAIVAALRADPAVAALVGGRVYDEPPEDVEFPYCRIGMTDLRILRLSGPWADDDVMLSVECHSRPLAGRVEAARIAHAVRGALDGAALSPAGHALEWLQFTTQAVTRGPDGRSYVATLAFEAAIAGPLILFDRGATIESDGYHGAAGVIEAAA